MQIISEKLLRIKYVSIFFLINAIFATNSFAHSTHTLTKGVWSLISIPENPGSNGTVNVLFGDDLPSANYGGDGSWIVFSFDANANIYRELSLDDILEPNIGY